MLERKTVETQSSVSSKYGHSREPFIPINPHDRRTWLWCRCDVCEESDVWDRRNDPCKASVNDIKESLRVLHVTLQDHNYINPLHRSHRVHTSGPHFLSTQPIKSRSWCWRQYYYEEL